MLRTILTEVGATSHGAAAMETAFRLAKAFGAQLQVLTCLDERTLQTSDVRQIAEDKAQAIQAEFLARCRQDGVDCVADLRVCERRATLLRLARRADLLVLGGTPRLHSPLAGFSDSVVSFAREVVRDVLFTRDVVPDFKSTVVGYAGRENSCNALRLTAHIAERHAGSVHVVTSEHDLVGSPDLLSLAGAYLEPFDVRVENYHSSEETASAIIGTVDQVSADVVAIGAYRQGRPHVTFGSTAQHVLQWSPVAVLLCR